ncbi:hypothetical protein [Zobellia laminariae]|uniref:hypothetical protein n=1 Tax=Zobellia laminariae TaxID=248906 RepID=UPI0026F46279|nr:hypothetical protein [Zobellia laminariae]WKX78275.1 hypothetical protein Q5W13_10465 [Zobellia laminariae]
MKKLFITSVFALGSLTAFAQEEQATEAVETATEAVAQEQDAFAEVALEEVPEAVTTMVATNYQVLLLMQHTKMKLTSTNWKFL